MLLIRGLFIFISTLRQAMLLLVSQKIKIKNKKLDALIEMEMEVNIENPIFTIAICILKYTIIPFPNKISLSF